MGLLGYLPPVLPLLSLLRELPAPVLVSLPAPGSSSFWQGCGDVGQELALRCSARSRNRLRLRD